MKIHLEKGQFPQASNIFIDYFFIVLSSSANLEHRFSRFVQCFFCQSVPDSVCTFDACHEKTDLKVFVIVMPKEGWARVV